jgi:hypothetical protein
MKVPLEKGDLGGLTNLTIDINQFLFTLTLQQNTNQIE